MRFATFLCTLLGLLLCSGGRFAPVSLAAPFEILAVMSYEAGNPWCREIRRIVGVLKTCADKPLIGANRYHVIRGADLVKESL